MLEEEKHERTEKADREASHTERSLIIRPLCGCSSNSSKVVVFTCPLCMGVALRAFQELTDAEIS